MCDIYIDMARSGVVQILFEIPLKFDDILKRSSNKYSRTTERKDIKLYHTPT